MGLCCSARDTTGAESVLPVPGAARLRRDGSQVDHFKFRASKGSRISVFVEKFKDADDRQMNNVTVQQVASCREVLENTWIDVRTDDKLLSNGAGEKQVLCVTAPVTGGGWLREICVCDVPVCKVENFQVALYAAVAKHKSMEQVLTDHGWEAGCGYAKCKSTLKNENEFDDAKQQVTLKEEGFDVIVSFNNGRMEMCFHTSKEGDVIDAILDPKRFPATTAKYTFTPGGQSCSLRDISHSTPFGCLDIVARRLESQPHVRSIKDLGSPCQPLSPKSAAAAPAEEAAVDPEEERSWTRRMSDAIERRMSETPIACSVGD
eukprot:TRINITY_DN19256_c0_g1_i2.p1 TRINITY_DN19256_c0_g1~~TRINITY_DN19256_c0_g1_i2.p1  ORF type:complete len:319 (-),score=70.03 TRINITY_DN19256_c0_g1_i2:209-1165(-)